MKYKFSGLTSEQVKESRKNNGDNSLPIAKGDGFWIKLMANFKDPLIIILVVALIVIVLLSFLGLTEWYEAVGISFAVLLSVFVSTFSEFKNENSFQKLQEEASKIYNKVFRDNNVENIQIIQIVKGDYILLQAGDKVPADGRIIQGEITVNQASLTGETEDIRKTVSDEEFNPKHTDFNSIGIVYRGAVVEDGEAVFMVESVGISTFYGKLTQELNINDGRLSPLQLKLGNLAKLISKFGYLGAGLIALTFIANKILFANNFDPILISEYFSNWQVIVNDVVHAIVLAIVIVVAAVPEGLPMMIAMVLSLNMRKMLNEKVLVRKLLGIETAGSLNILFSDKTGTITKGQLDPVLLIDGKSNIYNSYSEIPENLRFLIKTALLNNSFCTLDKDFQPVGGNSTERALLSFIDLRELKQDVVETKNIATINFNSTRKFSASFVDGGADYYRFFSSEKISFVKGAVEMIMLKTTAYFDIDGQVQKIDDKEKLIALADDMADKGIRLIGIACSDNSIIDDGDLPEGIALLGIVGIKDDVRLESKEAIEQVQKAGVQVVMITGDRKGTALAIAKEVGLVKSDTDVVLTTSELNELSDDEILKIIPNLRVVARALPTDKSRLVKLAQKLDLVVGMTGDGVNDSAAIKRADVGFAMGSGSEVTKEAGDIVILDDNFKSISNAIRYGRTIFKSIRKFLIFQLTVNVAAVLTAFLGPLMGVDFPLTIIQLLWINIIMDTLAALALGGEPALDRYMNEKPINRADNIISNYMANSVIINGLFITACSLIFLFVPYFKELFLRDGVFDNLVFLSAFFNVFIFLIVFNSFNARTEKLNLFDNIFKNKGFLPIIALIIIMQIVFSIVGGDLLRTVSHTLKEWLIILCISLLIIPFDHLRKVLFYLISKKKDL